MHARELAGFDPANFVLAMKYGYSVDALRPHPPGYPAFYLLWSAISIVSGFLPYTVLLATNMLFAILSLVLIYWAARRLFDERIAGLATMLAASNLLFLYYGSVGEMYVYDAAFSAFLVILLLVPTGRTELLLYVLYGILGSFRLSSVILTLPAVAVVQGIRLYRTRQFAPIIRNAGAFVLGDADLADPFYNLSWRLDSFLAALYGSFQSVYDASGKPFSFCWHNALDDWSTRPACNNQGSEPSRLGVGYAHREFAFAHYPARDLLCVSICGQRI